MAMEYIVRSYNRQLNGWNFKIGCVLPSHITFQLIGYYSDANGKYLYIMPKCKKTHVTCKNVTGHIGK